MILENREKGLKQLLAAMDLGSTGTIPLRRTDEPCEFHEDPEILDVREIDQSKNELEVLLSLPPCSAGLGTGLAMLLGSVCYCSVFSALKRFAVVDLALPKVCLDEYKGPRYGVSGIRKLLGVSQRPLLGLILKPRLRMSLSDILPTVQRALEGGVDYVIDDELLVSPSCSPFGQRAQAIETVVTAAQEKTGRKLGYFMNATADVETSLRLVEDGQRHGVCGFTLNCIAMGFSAVRHVIDTCDGQTAFVVNNIGRGVLTRKSTHYLAEQVIALLSRLAGGDAVYTGPFTQDFPYEQAILKEEIEKLQGDQYGLRPCFAVSSGSIFLEEIFQNVETFGADVMIQMGRGLLSDPERIRSSVTALVHILGAVSEASAPKDILTDVRRIVGVPRSCEERKDETVANGIPVEKQRLEDIRDNLRKDFVLLKRTEDTLRVEDRPKSIQRLEEDILEIRGRVVASVMEYEQLQMAGKIAATEAVSEARTARDVVVESFVSAMDHEPETEEMKALLEESREVLATLCDTIKSSAILPKVAERVSVTSTVLKSDISVTDKLKVTIPIIPLLLQYEGELSLGSKVSIASLWRKVVEFVNLRIRKFES
ncbi:MAG TPA: RuBisCO large subunit C-terminal-like domain-containing protein [bacterium]|nr:RuBisCO large subunit C-terminal-like domain-containing protein [bacterium]HPQ65692.1 RuBisCO large subunit C-terminal-like domain-containing protein [bacterium]